MKTILAALFLLASANTLAVCLVPLRPGLPIEQVLIDVIRGNNVVNVITAGATSDPNLVCCTRTEVVRNSNAWYDLLNAQAGRGTMTLAEFVRGIDVPGGEKTAAEEAICQSMTDRIIPPGRVVRNAQRADGARPMFTLNASDVLINLRVSGVQVYVEAGRSCERTPVISVTNAGSWLYVTNAAGVRGISLCR